LGLRRSDSLQLGPASMPVVEIIAGAAGAAALVGGAGFAKRRKDAAAAVAAAERGNQEVETARLERLKKAKEDFFKKKYNLQTLKQSLSSGAEVATVDECASLPAAKHNKDRFYSRELTTSNYAHWIDRVWNKDLLAFPHIIVQVSTPTDVAACLKFAAANALKVSVAAGCHSANCFVDGAFTIDMAKLKAAKYNPETKEVCAEAGAILSTVDAECRAHGRLVPVGTNGDTGVGGLTLSGGTGFLCRKFGMTVDNLVAIDIVLPDGTIIENIRDGSKQQDRELLWACRGSGGHFGIVTKFYFQTHEIPNNDQFLLGTVVRLCPTAAMKRAVIKDWWNKVWQASSDTTAVLVLPTAPVVPTMWLYCGPEAPKGKAALKTVADLKGVETPAGGLFNAENSWKVIDHKKVQTLVADEQAHGFIYQTMVACIDLTDGAIECIVDNIEKAPAGSVLLVFPLGGRVFEADSNCERCSLSTRATKAWILVESRWNPEVDGDAAGRERASGWCRQFVADINSKHGDILAKTTHAFSDVKEENAGAANNILVDVTQVEVAKKLKAIKARVDPMNVLSHNRKLSAKQ